MTKTKIIKSSPISRVIKLIGICTILPVVLATSGAALADSAKQDNGVLDERRPASGSGARVDNNQLKNQVQVEQRELATQSREQLSEKADNGERLAQVALGNDFASEAQMLTFAPAAANDAASDALQWYALAAKRGYPGAPSLDASGVSFYPVRVVRNR